MRQFIDIVENDPHDQLKIIPREDDIYDAFLGRTKVGHAQIDIHRKGDPADIRKIFRVHVNKEHRRHGIATALYDRIESDLAEKGLRLTPATGGALSDEASAFWQNRRP